MQVYPFRQIDKYSVFGSSARVAACQTNRFLQRRHSLRLMLLRLTFTHDQYERQFGVDIIASFRHTRTNIVVIWYARFEAMRRSDMTRYRFGWTILSAVIVPASV